MDRPTTQVQIIDGIHEVKANIVIAHKVLSSQGEVECIESTTEASFCCHHDVVCNSVNGRRNVDTGGKEVEHGGGVTCTEVPRAFWL